MTQVMRLWEGDAPGAMGSEDIDVPIVTIFSPPAERNSRAAIVICPGGGYGHLANHEGPVIGEWLADKGITGVVLRYRLAPKYRHPVMHQDISRAMRLVRARADELAIDRDKIGVLGFSAGGHLAATISTQWDNGNPDAQDPIERHSSRPDLSVLLYPVISMIDHCSHSGSRRNLLGENATADLCEKMSAERNVNDRTPPAFLFHTADDPGVPVENSVLYAMALRKAGVGFEMHIYEHGRHGVGLAADDPVLRTWPGLCLNWLATKGFGQVGGG